MKDAVRAHRGRSRVLPVSIGMTFGKLTVLELVPYGLWICRCACGATTKPSGAALAKGSARSCGAEGCREYKKVSVHAPVRPGQVYGRLTVVRRQRGTGRWYCLCECGRESTPDTNKLVTGSTKSCGSTPCRRRAS